MTVEQTAKDFGAHAMTLFTWLHHAEIDDKVPCTSSRTCDSTASTLPRELGYAGSPRSCSEDGDLVYYTAWEDVGVYYNAAGIDYSDATSARRTPPTSSWPCSKAATSPSKSSTDPLEENLAWSVSRATGRRHGPRRAGTDHTLDPHRDLRLCGAPSGAHSVVASAGSHVGVTDHPRVPVARQR